MRRKQLKKCQKSYSNTVPVIYRYFSRRPLGILSAFGSKMKGERSLIHFLSDCFYTYKPFLNLSEALFGLSDGLAYI
jgi:hypothetical protein